MSTPEYSSQYKLCDLSNLLKVKRDKIKKIKTMDENNKNINQPFFIPHKKNNPNERFTFAFSEFNRIKSFRNKKKEFDLNRYNTTSNTNINILSNNNENNKILFNTFENNIDKNNITKLIKPLDMSTLNEKKFFITNKIEEKKLITESDLSDSIYDELNKLNFDNLEHCQNLYENLLWLIKREDFKKDILNIKIFTYDYIQFIFNDDLKLIIENYKNILEIMKFFFYQIYLFLSILYVDSNKFEKLSLSYMNIINYSHQNFILIKQLLKLNKKEDKDIISLKKKNKIIESFLSMINPNLPSKKELETYLKNESNNENRIIKIIYALKNNSNLSNTLKNIEYKTIEYISNKLKEYSLKQFDKKKYNYTLILNLEYTILNYFEDNENSFVQVRYGTENFLQNLSKQFEILIISSFQIEYTNTIIDTFDPNKNIISGVIYKKSNEFFNLNCLGRSEKNTIIVDINYENFPFHKSNIIKISKFEGNENDKEILKLENDLNNHFKSEINDVRNIIKIIKEKYNC